MKSADKTNESTQSLADISREFSELEDLLKENDDQEISAYQTEIDKYLGDLEEKRDRKIDAYCAVIRKLENRGKARKTEGKRIGDLGTADLNKADGLRWLLLQFFKTQKLEKIETVRNRVIRATNGQAPIKLGKSFEENPKKIPVKYRKTIYQPNLKLIREALNEGKKLKFASFDEKGENIRIG